MRLKLPTGRKLAMDPEIFEVFEVERDRIDAIRAMQQAPDESFVTASVAPPAP